MLKRTDKELIVDQLKKEIGKSQAVFLTNLVGIKSSDAVKVRRDVRELNGKIIIARNTLLRRAAKGTSCENMLAKLKGPHAVAFAYGDAAAVAKSLNETSKEQELVKLLAGVFMGKELSAVDLQQLANLPSRDQMLATLLATFNAPISAFARVIEAIRQQKSEVVAGE